MMMSKKNQCKNNIPADKKASMDPTNSKLKLNGGMLALLIGVVCVVLLVAMIIAVGKDPVDDKHNLVTNAATPSEYSAQTYLIDSWREDFDNGAKKYYITLAMHSNDYYALIKNDDVKYLKDGKYEPLTEACVGSSVEVFNMNVTQSGICAYAKISTNELIDIKKIYVKMSGPMKYDMDTLSKDAYVEKYGTTDGWCSKLATVSERSIPHIEMFAMQGGFETGVIRLHTAQSDMYYYESTKNPVTNENSIVTKFNITSLKDCDIETLVNIVANQTVFANIVDGVVSEVKLDQRLQVISHIVDGEAWIGFETIDGSDISAYDWEIPDAIVHTQNGKTSYFIVK
jgi:hypothetical protein